MCAVAFLLQTEVLQDSDKIIYAREAVGKIELNTSHVASTLAISDRISNLEVNN